MLRLDPRDRVQPPRIHSERRVTRKNLDSKFGFGENYPISLDEVFAL
jgi:hypothetical protein